VRPAGFAHALRRQYVAGMPAPLPLFAACQPGLEPLLAGELRTLGAEPEPRAGGVAFAGDAKLVMRCGQWLGTASHLLVRIAEFRCRALGELQRKALDLPWREWLRPHVPIEVHGTTRGSRVYHTGAIEERIVEAIGASMGRKPILAGKDDEALARIHVRFRDDVCTVSLDVTGTPLHRRGYRLDARKAPLREDLAHALLLASGWQPGMALLDPFCGSGTIVIEAAGLALGLPPGRLRAPALQSYAPFDPDVWETVRRERRPAAATAPIVGSDRDAGAVEAARANAERAGVGAAVAFEHAAVSAQRWLAGDGAPATGAVVTNPPFGLRVAKGGDLRPLYQTLGAKVAALGPGWRLGLLAHDVRLARRTGLPLQAAWTTRHGGLAVTAMIPSP
jgi:putative N6-adenine-specific DNA methylase